MASSERRTVELTIGLWLTIGGRAGTPTPTGSERAMRAAPPTPGVLPANVRKRLKIKGLRFCADTSVRKRIKRKRIGENRGAGCHGASDAGCEQHNAALYHISIVCQVVTDKCLDCGGWQ